MYLPPGLTSFEANKASETVDAGGSNYFPLIAFTALFLFSNYGIWNVEWMMLSEVFPSKSVFTFHSIINYKLISNPQRSRQHNSSQ